MPPPSSLLRLGVALGFVGGICFSIVINLGMKWMGG
jgi:hypothetical protein